MQAAHTALTTVSCVARSPLSAAAGQPLCFWWWRRWRMAVWRWVWTGSRRWHWRRRLYWGQPRWCCTARMAVKTQACATRACSRTEWPHQQAQPLQVRGMHGSMLLATPSPFNVPIGNQDTGCIAWGSLHSQELLYVWRLFSSMGTCWMLGGRSGSSAAHQCCVGRLEGAVESLPTYPAHPADTPTWCTPASPQGCACWRKLASVVPSCAL